MPLFLLVFTIFAQAASIDIKFATNLGNFDVALDSTAAPITVSNFLAYVDSGFYNQTIFHRVIKNFVIQGGGFTAAMAEKPTLPPIANEAGNGLKNMRGTIAMARTDEINSATAQFFINTKDNSFLNHANETAQGFGYAVFGHVTSGMEIIDKIEAVGVQDRGEYDHVPLEPVLILGISRK